MRAVALRTFRDQAAGVIRERGEQFDASPARVDELAALGFADALEKKPARKRAARKPKE